MNILLVGVDYKYLNVALGKLSTYHKDKGDTVTLKHLKLKGFPSKKFITVDASGYDRVYASNIFEINQDKFEIINCNDISIGGIGSINPDLKLDPKIDSLDIDYSLFDIDFSYDFITRGCIRNCWFCKVPRHEGYLKKYNNLDKIIKHKKVRFLDNNILAYNKHKEIFRELIDRKLKCEFNQGLDFRLIDEENAELLSQLNYWGEYIFAFDDWGYKEALEKKLKIIKRHISKDWKLKFYIYHNIKFITIKDTINRVEWCRDNKCLPYIMRDKNCWDADINIKNFITDYCAYANQPAFFKKMTFEQFLHIRHTKRKRISSSLEIYLEQFNIIKGE